MGGKNFWGIDFFVYKIGFLGRYKKSFFWVKNPYFHLKIFFGGKIRFLVTIKTFLNFLLTVQGCCSSNYFYKLSSSLSAVTSPLYGNPHPYFIYVFFFRILNFWYLFFKIAPMKSWINTKISCWGKVIHSEAALQRYSDENVFWKYAPNLQENSHAEVEFQ